MADIHLDPKKRHDFVLLFDVWQGNPNGDPDAGNLPRVDPETMHGVVTDVALKRKVRDYAQKVLGLPIFIQSRVALNTLIKQAAEEKGIQADKKRASEDLRREMCRRYYDIRLFGAVLSTGDYNAGQVRGPVQLTFARSIDPVFPWDVPITRQARTSEERMETGTTEMGRKPLVPYGLYRAFGFFSPYLAEDTGVDRGDLEAFWEAMTHLFTEDRSASRGLMAVRGLAVFTHENPKGNAPAHRLFDLVRVERREGVGAPRAFADYRVVAPEAGPLEGFPGVHLTWLVRPETLEVLTPHGG
ncbi:MULTISPECIES: type I-C CRISPR-associated protein Cas7/Csd2 [Thermus]|uniref:Type I-C CRISPR-associated protein Cas7/Csd2 n=1 Tax=Thermus tengchongensis TaxID=1214928 RepID=A0A4Y9FCY6_9DEIN|nr:MULTISPECIES: type I-C CRISPR-associated protein Cas7/Csd2 [Thermus]TFU26490.1 type I-C CRISPR-associated protein Cas7/Csd2 [Thermus tengchongensis]